MRTAIAARNPRNVLCVFPHYTPAFGTFAHAFPLLYDVKAFMPPQGLLLIAAYLPERWQVRFVDENMTRATEADFAWADIVFVIGHARAGAANPRHPRPRQSRRQGDGAGRSFGVGLRRRCIRSSNICISARWATRPMH